MPCLPRPIVLQILSSPYYHFPLLWVKGAVFDKHMNQILQKKVVFVSNQLAAKTDLLSVVLVQDQMLGMSYNPAKILASISRQEELEPEQIWGEEGSWGCKEEKEVENEDWGEGNEEKEEKIWGEWGV